METYDFEFLNEVDVTDLSAKGLIRKVIAADTFDKKLAAFKDILDKAPKDDPEVFSDYIYEVLFGIFFAYRLNYTMSIDDAFNEVVKFFKKWKAPGKDLVTEINDKDTFVASYDQWLKDFMVNPNDLDNEVSEKHKFANMASSTRYPVAFTYKKEDGSVEFIDCYLRNNFDKDSIGTSLYNFATFALLKSSEVEVRDVSLLFWNHLDKLGLLSTEDDQITMYNIVKRVAEVVGDEVNPRDVYRGMYETFDRFTTEHKIWTDRITKKVQVEHRNTLEILEMQSKLASFESVVHRDRKIQTSTSNFIIKTGSGKRMTFEDRLYFLAGCKPSHDAPYVYLKTPKEDKIYIYHCTTDSVKTPMKQVVHTEGETAQTNRIYFTIFSREGEFTNKNESYLKLFISLKTGELSVTLPEDKARSNLIMERIRNFIPEEYTMEKISDTKFKGTMRVEGVTIENNPMIYLVINDPMVANYFYIDESSDSMANKRKKPFSLRYRSLNTNLTFEDSGATGIAAPAYASFGGQEGDDLALDVNTGAGIRVNISAKDEPTLERFIRILTRFLKYYEYRRPQIKEMLSEIIDFEGLKTTVRKTDGKVSGREPAWTKCKDLQRISESSIFSGNYTRKCQLPKQPIVISQDEIAEWEQELNPPVRIGGPEVKVGEKREVMSREYGGKMMHFVCPTNRYPYPTIVNEHSGSTSEETYPCCNSTPSDIKKIDSAKTGQIKAKEAARVGYYGNFVKVPLEITDILNINAQDGNFYDFTKMNVPATKSSLIHCILQARGKNGFNLLSNEDKNKKVEEIRKDIANTVHPACCKQELFDMSLDEITSNLANLDVNLDPHLYYRAVEEYFKVNIYVFNFGKSLYPLSSESTNNKSTMEIPRCRLAHFRPKRLHRPSFIIVNSPFGNEGETRCNYIYSRGELVDGRQVGVSAKYGDSVKVIDKKIHYFNGDMTNRLHEILNHTMRVFTINRNSQGDQMNIRNDPFSVIRWSGEDGKLWDSIRTYLPLAGKGDIEMVGQRVDIYGKLRVLKVRIGKSFICFSTPPGQPLNLPIIEKLTSAPEKLVLEIFGNPTDVTANGFWFRAVDDKHGLYVLTKHKRPPTCDKIISPINCEDESSEIVSYNRKSVEDHEMQRAASIMVQIVNWLWRLDSRTDIDKWWKKYVISNPNCKYEPVIQFREFPEVESAVDGIKEMHKFWPNFFNTNGTICLYPALYTKLYSFMRQESRVLSGMLDPIPTRLNNVYSWSSDFPTHPGVRFFISRSHFELWIKSLCVSKNYSNITRIYDFIDFSMSDSVDPVVIFNQTSDEVKFHEGKWFILQNVKSGDIRRVYAVCQAWMDSRENIGYNAEPIEISFPNVIYAISKINRLIHIENNTKAKSGAITRFFEILQYSKSHFAALLPII